MNITVDTEIVDVMPGDSTVTIQASANTDSDRSDLRSVLISLSTPLKNYAYILMTSKLPLGVTYFVCNTDDAEIRTFNVYNEAVEYINSLMPGFVPVCSLREILQSAYTELIRQIISYAHEQECISKTV